MEVLSDQERRTRRAYRWVMTIGIVVVVGLSVWLAIPPKPVDLRVLRDLKPKIDPMSMNTRSYRSYRLAQKPGDVEKFLDDRLVVSGHWWKTMPGKMFGDYQDPRGLVSVSFAPNYGSAPNPSGKVVGTILSVSDDRHVAILP